jgi:hypothetical protein
LPPTSEEMPDSAVLPIMRAVNGSMSGLHQAVFAEVGVKAVDRRRDFGVRRGCGEIGAGRNAAVETFKVSGAVTVGGLDKLPSDA